MKNIVIVIVLVLCGCMSNEVIAQCEGNEFCQNVNEFNAACDGVSDALGKLKIPTGRGGMDFCNMTSVGNWAARSMCDPDFCGAIDPNIKYGPGNNADRVHTSLKTLHYSILFENLQTATAHAAEVWVYDTLEPDKFELSSFRFGEIHLGETTLSPFEGNPHENFAVIDLRATHGIDLKIDVRFDPLTGIAQWHFLSLDPDTYQKVIDPGLGFLPPNSDGTEGTAGVTYFVQRLDLNSGDSIRNHASIVFDANDPFVTGEWLTIVDITPPESHVSSLPVQSPSTFLVEWSGQDVHAGILYYNVYVSVNDGPFNPWIKYSTELSSSFQGEDGHKYEFYTIAVDHAGNREFAPAGFANSPDAVTTINACLDLVNDCDLDQDGFSSVDGDCDDTNPGINPLAAEVCNGIDDNCNGLIDDADPTIEGQLVWYQDTDGDDFGSSVVTLFACLQPVGYTGTGTDCDDDDAEVNPGAMEVNDGEDNDCDGLVDEGFSALSVNAGDCQFVYLGYAPMACTTLSVTVQGGVAPYSYTWSNGATASIISVCPVATTIYTIVVTDHHGVSAQDVVTVQVIDIVCGNNKVSICHVPPGNPENTQTLCVSINALDAHLAHGDLLGACESNDPCNANQSMSSHASIDGSVSNEHAALTKIENSMDQQIMLFPNPTTGLINIKMPNSADIQMRIFSLDGIQMTSREFIQTQSIVVDIHEFPDGIYVVELKTTYGYWQEKIVKL